MMKIKYFVLAILFAFPLSGCTSGLNSFQEREYRAFENSYILVKDKNPNTGATLGLLPGGGSFYAHEPGLGIVNLLLWPISILWDPINGYQGAMKINYDITKQKLKKDKNKEITLLNYKLYRGALSAEEYAIKTSEVEQRYSFD